MAVAAAAAAFGASSSLNPKCKTCSKVVYRTELISYDNQTWHKSCFRCENCGCVVSLGGVAMLQGKLFCKNCFKRLFKERGTYNFTPSGGAASAGSGAASGPSLTASSFQPTQTAEMLAAKQTTSAKCSAPDCGILRAANKLYCARHSNLAAASPLPEESPSASDREDAGPSPLPSAPLRRPFEHATPAPPFQRLATLGQLHAHEDSASPGRSDGLHRTGSKSTLVGNHTPGREASSGPKPEHGRIGSESLSGPGSGLLSALSRQGSKQALDALTHTHSTHFSPRSALSADPAFMEFSSHVKHLQWENASLRQDVETLKATVQDLAAKLAANGM